MTDAVMYARFNRDANKQVCELLGGLSREEREKDRGGDFSLSGSLLHMAGSTAYFLELYRPALAGNAEASKALSALPELPAEGPLDDAQWGKLAEAVAAIDAAYLGMASALGEADLRLPVKIDWYKGDPESLPLSFLLGLLVVHNTHHRGQISQTLDEMKIKHDVWDMQFFPD